MVLTIEDMISFGRHTLISIEFEKDPHIDILHYNEFSCGLMSLAIRSRNIETVRLLLDYYEKNMLSEYTEESDEHSKLRGKMCDVITSVKDYIKDREMKELLGQHSNFGDGDEISSNGSTPINEDSALTKESLIKLNEENGTKKEDSSSSSLAES